MATTRNMLFVGVDVGGTKILATLVDAGGRVLQRERISTPREKNPALVVEVILDTIRDVVSTAGEKMTSVAAAGMAIPGVVDPIAGKIINTANMNLGGVEIVPLAVQKLGIPVFLGNDVNLGTLGEQWLGTAAGARSVVGIFVGTGIGGGVVVDGKLVTGASHGAGEIGHMIMALGGPKCGCGLRGCFESLASRTAIERDIRAAINGGRKSAIQDLVALSKPEERIRSGSLKKALSKKDPLVTEILQRAAEVMGLACLCARRMVDPDVLLFGGGVIEACGNFILPIVEKIVKTDPLAAPDAPVRILESSLGDDAVALGAVALAQGQLGMNPLARTRRVRYPKVSWSDGRAVAARKRLDRCLVRANGELVADDELDGKLAADLDKGRLGDKSIRQLCQAKPAAVFVAVDPAEPLKLSERAKTTLHFRDVELKTLPGPEAVTAFSEFKGRKVLLVAGPHPDSSKSDKNKSKDDEDD